MKKTQTVAVVCYDGGFDWWYDHSKALEQYTALLSDPDYTELYYSFHTTEDSPRDVTAQERINQEIEENLDQVEQSAKYTFKR